MPCKHIGKVIRIQKQLVEIMVRKNRMGQLAKYKKKIIFCMQKATYVYKKTQQNTIINLAT